MRTLLKMGSLSLREIPQGEAFSPKLGVDSKELFSYNITCSAGVAHLVERHLAKVEVASSSLVTRSNKKRHVSTCRFLLGSVPVGRFTQGDFTCSGEMNSPCAKVLPVAKRLYGA